MTRILIDATHTARTNFNTGIQRVVRRVAECSQTFQDRVGAACIPVQYHRGRLVAVPRIAGLRSWDEGLLAGARKFAAAADRPFGCGIATLSPTASRFLQHVGTRCRKALYPRSLVRSGGIAMDRLRGREIKLQRGDIMLMLDASWESSPRLYELARQRGCYIAQVVYDLLPLTHPQFFKPQIVADYRQWIEFAFEHVDGFWAISQTVRDELHQYYQRHQATTNTPRPATAASLTADKFRSFQLGADLQPPGQNIQPRSSIRAIFESPRPVFLSVGTIEARKNYQWLVSVFERFWAGGGEAKLVLAGRPGWASAPIRDCIELHPCYGTRLFWYHDASDDEIQYMYRYARALTYPSLAEGFGLPIIEALHQGTEVLASDTPIHHEVGGDDITYFSLENPADLADKLRACSGTPKSSLPNRQRPIPTWYEGAYQLLNDVRIRSESRSVREGTSTERAA